MATLPMTAEQMLAAAVAETGIDIDDSEILLPLTKLVHSYNIDGKPHESGANALHGRIMRSLKNRLRMKRDFEAHPEINEQRVERPIFICGMARTGSTKMQKLLASSQDFNFFHYWSALNPSLISGDRGEPPQERIDDAQAYATWFDQQSPDTKAGHHFAAHEPEEDSDVLGHSFVSPVWYGWAPLDSYLAWLPEVGLKAQFEMLRNVFKYQQWQGIADPKKRWMTKGPLYSGLEPLLLDVFPDATLVMTHRTHLKTVGSGLRLLECFYAPFTDLRPEPTSYVAGVKGAADIHMNWRASQPANRFIDIPFSASVKNPEAVIRAIYEYANEPLSDESLRRMLDWNRSNPQNKFGRHEYTLGQYGLSADDIRETFAEYESFNDELETKWGYPPSKAAS